MSTAPFNKIINPGAVKISWYKRPVHTSIFVRIAWDGTSLSLTGVVGPLASGNARGGCGQIQDRLSEIARFAPGWDALRVIRLQEIWHRWHLNDMRAGCEHQRHPWTLYKDAMGHIWEISDVHQYTAPQAITCRTCGSMTGEKVTVRPPWTERRINEAQPLDAYGDFHLPPVNGRPGYTLHKGYNMLVWVSYTNHRSGLLSKPCPVCAYRYGSAWLHEDVPDDILAELTALPDTTVNPAWV